MDRNVVATLSLQLLTYRVKFHSENIGLLRGISQGSFQSDTLKSGFGNVMLFLLPLWFHSQLPNLLYMEGQCFLSATGRLFQPHNKARPSHVKTWIALNLRILESQSLYFLEESSRSGVSYVLSNKIARVFGLRIP